jgi:hypothetical protein
LQLPLLDSLAIKPGRGSHRKKPASDSPSSPEERAGVRASGNLIPLKTAKNQNTKSNGLTTVAN